MRIQLGASRVACGRMIHALPAFGKQHDPKLALRKQIESAITDTFTSWRKTHVLLYNPDIAKDPAKQDQFQAVIRQLLPYVDKDLYAHEKDHLIMIPVPNLSTEATCLVYRPRTFNSETRQWESAMALWLTALPKSGVCLNTQPTDHQALARKMYGWDLPEQTGRSTFKLMSGDIIQLPTGDRFAIKIPGEPIMRGKTKPSKREDERRLPILHRDRRAHQALNHLAGELEHCGGETSKQVVYL